MSRSTTTSAAAPQTGKGMQAAATPKANVSIEKVAARAYQKWLEKGCPHGTDKQDWLEAEAEIKAEMTRPAAPATQARR